MKKNLMKYILIRARLVIAMSLLLMNCSLAVGNEISLVCNTMRYITSSSSQWSEWSKCTVPIFLGENEITFGTIPLAVFNILDRTEQTSGNVRNETFRCNNSKGTEFLVKLLFSPESDVVMTVENKDVTMSYKCTISNIKPHYNMVDLGLSCKWGLSNYYNYSTDIVSAVFGAGKRLTFDEAYKLFGSSKQHLPSTSQINELLTKCSWEFIENPYDENYKCYLVTGPNGNSIYLPCEDGGIGNLSSAWYLGSYEVDAFLAEAMQLNVNNKVVFPFERQYFGCVRLVEDK